MSDEQLRPDRIMEIANGYWATGVLGVAARYSVFTHLEAGVDTAEALAAKTGLAERGTQTLLDALVGLGLVQVRDGYRNSPEASAFLVEGEPASLVGYAGLKLGEMVKMTVLPEVFSGGGPLTEPMVEVVDNPHWEHVVPAIAAQSVPVAHTAAEILKLADAGAISILDVGGGSGIFSGTWLAANPVAHATQLDWAPINAIARRLVGPEVADRFDVIDGDFHTVELAAAAYDVIVYSHVAHQEGPQDNAANFLKLRGALKPGGTLVICDYVVDDDRGGPPFALAFASEMLLKSRKGGTWRRADYTAWLEAAGFTDVSFHLTPSPTTIVLAR
ncbi:methyltransferase [Catenulispora rubra]|uniref:methyltransferase n=1 Tax=Catenulispora rubra TaxID=280293 RepID=UPI002B271CBA|nr:methyltransferase dimerization domain-containing protein [Catenulispora rubra]